jgi:beta-aspartyl-peptidase (threonine type)
MFQRFADMGGVGGVIAVDAKANIVMPFSSEGMYRGFVNSKGEKKTMIYH